MAEYRLVPQARDDLDRVWEEGARRWGTAQAERYLDSLLATFALLADFPEIARLRREIVPAVRIHPHQAHLIVYRDDQGVAILRILHGRQDLLAALDA